jgi:2',3'-cyclic-nucleotide 2'-phosphodiesterase (5'-nucleotidase family)
VQSGSHGKMLGQLDLKVKDKRVTSFSQTLFPIRASELSPDPEIQDLITKLRAPYKAELERVIGETTNVLYRQGTWQSTADNLVTDALRARTNQQIAMSESGRYGATILPGPITVEDVYNLVPTEAPIYHMRFLGKDLREMFEAAIDNVITDKVMEQIGGNLWRFSGLAIKVDVRKPYPERIQEMYIKGKPLDSEKLYSLAEFNLFLRNNPGAVDVKPTDSIGPHEVIAYIEKQQKITPKLDSRITDHHGNIMGDHAHLHEIAHQTGRSEVDLDANIYQYHGQIDQSGYLKILEK